MKTKSILITGGTGSFGQEFVVEAKSIAGLASDDDLKQETGKFVKP